MDTKIIDNFLNSDELDKVRNSIIKDIPLYYTGGVVGIEKTNHHMGNIGRSNDNVHLWNYYFSHLFFTNDDIKSNYYPDLYKIFIPKIEEIYHYKALMRMKLNFYPHTETLREHDQHCDTKYSHYGAIFSINTCNGFTRLHDGTKVDSIENRMLFFDPSLPHNSTTTTNAHARININFNFL